MTVFAIVVPSPARRARRRNAEIPSAPPLTEGGWIRSADDQSEQFRMVWRFSVAAALHRAGHTVVSAPPPEWPKAGSPDVLMVDRTQRDESPSFSEARVDLGLPALVIVDPGDHLSAAAVLGDAQVDCMPWDSSVDEAVLRLERLAAGGASCSRRTIRVGPLMIDLDARRTFLADVELRLTGVQQAVLSELAGRAGETVRTASLLEVGWDAHQDASEVLLRPQLCRLRKLLAPFLAVTSVRGRGYVLEVQCVDAA